MSNYKTPGVYIEEISFFPPSVAQVETAIPAFIGYTEKGPEDPTRISSMIDFKTYFGGPKNEIGKFGIDGGEVKPITIPATPDYKFYYMLEMFFANGGGDCYIISVGNYDDPISDTDMKEGLAKLNKEDVPTLVLFPDADKLGDKIYGLYGDALIQCADRKDRFLICDVKQSDDLIDPVGESAAEFRGKLAAEIRKFGAAYFPYLKTTLNYQYQDEEIEIEGGGTLDALYKTDNKNYHAIKNKIESVRLVLPPSAAMAGVYARVDSAKGVWKAPANVSLHRVSTPNLLITHNEQEDLNAPTGGEAINAIRNFKGKGVMVWGARTLDANSNEWRYVSVRRFFNMVEESVKNAAERFLFEPNDANTWVKVKAMTENYLTTLWRDGALMGAKPDDAFFVRVGLNETMTEAEINEGLLVVEIGLAAVRPAEFIILRFSHKMMKS